MLNKLIVVKYIGNNELIQEHEGDAGVDLRSEIDTVIKPFETICIPTGIYVEIPKGYEGQVRPRSGLAKKHSIIIPNSPGTVDAGYRGEVGVILFNLGKKDFIINKNDRIGQLVICPIANVQFVKVDKLSDTTRGVGGFGSTGIN